VHEASARDKVVMAHAENTQSIKNAILGGVWSVEHGCLLDDEAIQMFLDTGTYFVPTLSVIQAIANIIQEPAEGSNADRSTTQNTQASVELVPYTRPKAEVETLVRESFKSFKKAVDAGVKIAVGTDAYFEKMHGENALELELMVRYGLSPMQSIVAATKTASEACRVDDKVGTLEVGKLADLLVVDGNPLEDISILQDKSVLLLIMKDGHIYVDRMNG
jgi:imidazolonepropionase-like amidohydrolase